MIAAGVENYGAAMSASPRKDVGVKYAWLIPEIALYAEDGANIMIKNSWWKNRLWPMTGICCLLSKRGGFQTGTKRPGERDSIGQSS